MGKSKRQWEEQRNLEIALDEQGFYNELESLFRIYNELLYRERLEMMLGETMDDDRTTKQQWIETK